MSQGTGQFGAKAQTKNDQNANVGEFNLGGIEASPRIRNKELEKNNEVNQLLA